MKSINTNLLVSIIAIFFLIFSAACDKLHIDPPRGATSYHCQKGYGAYLDSLLAHKKYVINSMDGDCEDILQQIRKQIGDDTLYLTKDSSTKGLENRVYKINGGAMTDLGRWGIRMVEGTDSCWTNFVFPAYVPQLDSYVQHDVYFYPSYSVSIKPEGSIFVTVTYVNFGQNPTQNRVCEYTVLLSQIP